MVTHTESLCELVIYPVIEIRSGFLLSPLVLSHENKNADTAIVSNNK